GAGDLGLESAHEARSAYTHRHRRSLNLSPLAAGLSHMANKIILSARSAERFRCAGAAGSHLPPCCMARGHDRRVFGDMTDTSSLHGIGCKEAHPCHGKRCRLWSSDESSYGLRCRPERIGGSCAGGLGFIRILATSGSIASPEAMGSWQIDRAGHTRALDAVMRPLRLTCWTYARPIQPGAHARSRAALKTKGQIHRRLRPCTRFCSGMVLWFVRLVRPRGLVNAS